jgi:hypothetical protein
VSTASNIHNALSKPDVYADKAPANSSFSGGRSWSVDRRFSLTSAMSVPLSGQDGFVFGAVAEQHRLLPPGKCANSVDTAVTAASAISATVTASTAVLS